jgi:hypothetical protein
MSNSQLTLYDYDDICEIISTELCDHPKTSLTDYYKLFFQAYFGQGHFIGGRDNAISYLKTELAQMTEDYLPICQDISNGHEVYRISLTAVSQGIVTKEEFIDKFIRATEHEINWDHWQHSWVVISSILVDKFGVKTSSFERAIVQQTFAQKSLMSHSEAYRKAYHPHYRVMQLSDFDSFLLKLQ